MYNLILNAAPSVFLGALFTLLFFVASFLLVIGFKAAAAALKQYFPAKEKQIPPPPEPVRKPRPRKKAKPIRSIEINPEEVDRIYVKKIS